MRFFSLALLALLAAPPARAQPVPPTVAAVRAGDDAALREALAAADVDAADADGATALLWAAYDGRLDAARLLVKADAAVNGVQGVIWTDATRTGYYGSALAAAAGRGHLEIVRLLVAEAGADVDAPEWNPASGAFDGWTPLQWAASEGHAAVAALLAGADAALDRPGDPVNAPLLLAAQNGHEAAGAALLAAGADPDTAPAHGWTALHYAARDGRTLLVTALLDAGAAQLLGRDPAWTPLLLAAHNGHESVARLLVCAGGDPAVTGQDGATASTLATAAGHTALAAALAAAGTDCDAVQAEARFALGGVLQEAGLYAAAEPAFEAALLYYDRPGADADARDLTLRALAFTRFLASRYAEALPVQQRYVEAAEARGDTTEAAFAHHNLGYLLLQMDRLDEAATALDRALVLRRRLYAPGEENLVLTLDAFRDLHTRRAEAHLAGGDALAAWSDYGQALGYADEAHGRESTASMGALVGMLGMLDALQAAIEGGDFGMQQTMDFDLERTADLFDRVVAFAEANGFGDHPNLAVLAHLRDQARIAALMMGDEEDTGERVRLAERLVAQAEAARNDHALSSALSALGAALKDAGAFAEAEAAYARLLALREALYGPAALEVAEVYRDLGRLAAGAGRLADARRHHEQAVAVASGALPPDAPALADFLDPLASLLNDLGDRQQAERLTERIVALETARYGEASVEAAFRLADLARYRAAEGDAAQARAYQERSIALLEAAFEATASEAGYALLVASRGTLGQYLLTLGEREEALRLVGASLAFARERFGAESLLYGHALGTQSSVLFETGDVPGAAEAREASLALLERHLGPDHPETAAARIELGNLRLIARRYDEAGPLLLEAGAAFDRYVHDVLPSLALAEQRLFLETTLTEATDFLILVSAVRPDVLPEAYRLFGGWKGLLLRGVAQQAAAARLESDPAHAADAARLRAVRAEIAALVQQSGTMEGAAWTAARDRLTTEKEVLERRLGSAGGSALEDPWTSGADLGAALPAASAFVDVYKHGQRYSAVVTASGAASRLVDLGPAGDAERAVAAWRDAVVRGDGAEAEGDAVRGHLWAPVAAALPAGTARVWVSADAALARIPWTPFAASSPAPAGVLVAEVPSGRALLPLLAPNRPRLSGHVLLVGGVDFDAGVEGAPEGAPAGARWPALPGTRAEVDAIAALALTRDIATETLTGAAPTPGTVARALDRRAGGEGAVVAHFATHGFFYGDETTPAAVASRTEVLGAAGPAEASMARNPLAESGLALAGANAGPAGALSAEELVGLDLSGLQLVTLSACETGRGTEVTGQGVLGLQASVLGAGARSLLMSLWKVPDASTALLMERFYAGLWEGLAPAAALHNAQLDVRRDPRFEAPVHWAAWVLSGDAF